MPAAWIDPDVVAAQKWTLGHAIDSSTTPELGSTETMRHELALAGFLENITFPTETAKHRLAVGQLRP